MRPRTPTRRRAVILWLLPLGLAACTVEINIDLRSDETPPEPNTTAAPDTPPDRADPADESDSPPSEVPPELGSLEPPPPIQVVPLPSPSDRFVRDALFRYHEQVTEPPPLPPTDRLRERPQFTPFTVAPRVLNRDEVEEALRAEYPSELREAGVGGTVRLHFFVEVRGSVGAVVLDESSGHPALDRAALRVAHAYRFAPARNGDRFVPVWVSLPLSFRTD